LVGRFQVKFLTFSDIVRVNVQFSTTEDSAAVETQLSEISGVRVMSLTNDVINTFTDGQWRTERMLTVYGINNKDGSLVPASELEKSVKIIFMTHNIIYILLDLLVIPCEKKYRTNNFIIYKNAKQ